MKPLTKLIIVLLVLLGIIAALTGIFGLFNIYMFLGTMYYAVIFAAIYGYLRWAYGQNIRRESQSERSEKDMSQCWGRANEILSNMPGREAIQWDEGFSRLCRRRRYNDGSSKWFSFWGFIGYTAVGNQIAIVIYDIKADDIADYITNPSTAQLRDPFDNFKPFDSGSSMRGDDMFNPYGMRYRKGHPYHRRYPMMAPGGVSVNVGGRDDERYTPNSSVVDSLIGGGDD